MQPLPLTSYRATGVFPNYRNLEFRKKTGMVTIVNCYIFKLYIQFKNAIKIMKLVESSMQKI